MKNSRHHKHHNDFHTASLDKLLTKTGLHIIDEDLIRIRLILREPQLYYPDSIDEDNSPDLILNYYNNHTSIIELKHSKSQYRHAIKQLENGIYIAQKIFGFLENSITGKIVYYDNDRFQFEVTHEKSKRVRS